MKPQDTHLLTLKTDVNVFRGDSAKNIVHMPLVGRAFTVDDKVRGIIEDLRAGHPIASTETNLQILSHLTAIGVIGKRAHGEPKTHAISEFKPTEATLIFTETCNLGCSYCYASSLAAKSKPMSEEIMRAAIDLVCGNAARTESRNASFRYIGGGEPTAEWRFLEATTEYVHAASRTHRVRPFIRLITNGTLLTRGRAEWIADNLDFVTLSFDILPELQASRPYANGTSSHRKLMGVVRLLCDQGVEFHLRSTISVAGSARLEEMVQYVHDHTGAKSIRFEPMSEIGRALDSGVSKPTQEVFVESFKAAYRLGKRLGIDVTCKMFTNTERRNSRFCDAEFAVTPDGVVTACHRYSRQEHSGFDLFRIGEFDGRTFQFDIDHINKVRAIDVHSFADCETCMARWNCAGGCLSARVGADGVSQKGPLCELTRELLKFSIEEKLGEAHDG